MDRPQLIRRLRIAVSVFFAVLTLAICVLWVRSLRYTENCSRISQTGRLISIGSSAGYIYLVTMRHQLAPPSVGVRNHTGLIWAAHHWRYSVGKPSRTLWLPKIKPYMTGWHVAVPLWILVSLSALGGGLSWFQPRFSLRTLLIATTLVAVALGLKAWAAG